MEQEKQPDQADIGDYLKLCACTAVMMQTILSLALTTNPSAGNQAWIGILYNFVKFTAPAFIFGILYSTTRTTIDARTLTYGQYMKGQWHALFVPAIWWTTIYLVGMPWVQQVNHYHDVLSFLWHFVNGNAAPHLWYNTMMLQFIIVMPLFWAIGRWCGHNAKRGWMTLIATVLVASLWLWFYDVNIFHGPHMQDWYLFDRFFFSFFIYGVFGVLAWQFRTAFNRLVTRAWPLFLLIFAGSFYWINHELFGYGFPVNLGNAPYYKPSMTIYDLAVIALIAAFGLFQIRHRLAMTKFVHRFAAFAYKSYLANVFWAQILWFLFGKQLTLFNTALGVIVTYLCVWCCSFATSFTVHAVWTRVKAQIER
ncbi:integral membrane protein [Lactobacillus selangorensis]|uniref:Integral membrane protein n=1 Tax=Lactobacillus selangorensis TaxID=81857 RepID=A0A0R2FT32_9LACO|nr:acyltransferase family protein [Lactobacillus selangorensis]KRN28599.1 integral membrane protein [Lactobacillus selangorensis]KRN32991.1 integral membrane protein [Lactobacillus selangorensis]